MLFTMLRVWYLVDAVRKRKLLIYINIKNQQYCETWRTKLALIVSGVWRSEGGGQPAIRFEWFNCHWCTICSTAPLPLCDCWKKIADGLNMWRSSRSYIRCGWLMELIGTLHYHLPSTTFLPICGQTYTYYALAIFSPHNNELTQLLNDATFTET